MKRLGTRRCELLRDVVGDVLRRPGVLELAQRRRGTRPGRRRPGARLRCAISVRRPRPSSIRRANAAASVGSGSAGRRGRARPRRSARAARRRVPSGMKATAIFCRSGMFFSRYFSASLHLQRDQPAQAGAVLRRGDLGLVEDLDLDVRSPCRSAPESRPASGRPCAISISSGSSPKVQAV